MTLVDVPNRICKTPNTVRHICSHCGKFKFHAAMIKNMVNIIYFPPCLILYGFNISNKIAKTGVSKIQSNIGSHRGVPSSRLFVIATVKIVKPIYNIIPTINSQKPVVKPITISYPPI